MYKGPCSKLFLYQKRIITLLKNAKIIIQQQWDDDQKKAGCINYGYLTTNNQILAWQIDLLGSVFIKNNEYTTYLQLNGDIDEGAGYAN